MPEQMRILIVDDHAITRRGLRTVLQLQPDMQLVGEAANGREAVAATAALRPDLVLMDLLMPILGGVDAIAAIKKLDSSIRIVALTTFADAELVLGAVQAGVDGFLLKDVGVDELMRAIRTVQGGEPYLHREATRQLLHATAAAEPPGGLTGRERQVLRFLAAGYTNRRIAEQLLIAEKTVSVHVSTLLSKLGLRSRTQAAVYAYLNSA